MNTDTNNIKYLTEEELSKLDSKRLDQLVKKTRILDSKLDTESEDIQKDIDKLLLMKQIISDQQHKLHWYKINIFKAKDKL